MPNLSHSPVAILGAGPVGLEAAVACLQRGIPAIVYERGATAENIRHWAQVRLFSPFKMNSSEAMQLLLTSRGVHVPHGDAVLTGDEFLKQVLEPVGKILTEASILRTETQVIQIGRSGALKGDLIGSPQRISNPFRMLIEERGQRRIVTTDYVIDCTGTFGNHNHLGNGGLECPGEYAYRELIRYDLPDLLRDDQLAYLGRHTLVIGSGYSAATNIKSLSQLVNLEPATKVTWMTRHKRDTPLERIKNDQLTERDQLTREVNQLVAMKDGPVTWMRDRVVDRIDAGHADGWLKITATANDGSQIHMFEVERILANVGFRPDRLLYEELQIHECYASGGPMKLAAKLLGEGSTDCLGQGSHGIASLLTPEPNFFICGAKSYGRNSRFLMRIGIEQINLVADRIAESLQR